MSKEYYWGIDAGWTAYGICVLDSDRKVVWHRAMNPSQYGFSKTLDELPLDLYPPSVITLERYVAYSGRMSKYSEHILMMIGATVDRTRGVPQFFFRAIDWKNLLVRKLFKESDFKNPSTKLDKKFSLAAAEHLVGVRFKTDHEADAACLAYIGSLGIQGKTYE